MPYLHLFARYIKMIRNSLSPTTVQNFASIGSAIRQIQYKYNDAAEVSGEPGGILPLIRLIDTPRACHLKMRGD